MLGDFLRDISRRGHENRDRSGADRLEVLIYQAVEGGATTVTAARERIEPHLRVKDSSNPWLQMTPQADSSPEAKRMQKRSCLRAVFVRSREAGDPGKVRGQVKAEDFGFPTSTDSSGPETT